MNPWGLFKNKNSKRQRVLGSNGQVVVEYVLLLVIVVSVAVIITTSLVSRNEESPGLLVQKWRSIVEVIASDKADSVEN